MRFLPYGPQTSHNPFQSRERDIRSANLRRFLYHFLFRGVGHEVRILSYAIAIDIQLLDSDVDGSTAEFHECRLEWSWILIGHQAVGVEILDLSKPLRT